MRSMRIREVLDLARVKPALGEGREACMQKETSGGYFCPGEEKMGGRARGGRAVGHGQ